MIIYEYANEKHIVEEFIEHTRREKIIINNREKVFFFVWGYELWLPEGGKAGYSGSIDLIATDEQGRVWLIEAKQSGNPELNSQIWLKQILNYRRALARRTHEEISMKTRRFLLNNGATHIHVNNTNGDYQSLFDAFIHWAEYIGKNESFARNIYNKTIQSIKDENVVSSVMADTFRNEVWQNKPQDNKPYAYIVSKGTGKELQLTVLLEENMDDRSQVYDYSNKVMNWADITREKKKVKPTPETVDTYLANQVVMYYQQCLLNLKELGWDGRYHANSKAFVIDMPTKCGPAIRIHLGWVDFDGAFSIANRLPGELGLKFNIDFRHFKNCGVREHFDVGYALARRLATVARYNGRGKGLNIQYRDLMESEKQEWDWEMYRRIDRENRDFLGREDERKDFMAAWQFLVEIIK
jgi:hypothetical protein